MTFPKKLPKKIADAGRLVAQLRFDDDKSGCNDGSAFIFVVVDEHSLFHVFCAVRCLSTGRLHVGSIGSWTYCDIAVKKINDYMARLRYDLHAHLVEGEVWRNTADGKTFADTFLGKYLELPPAASVQIRH